MWYPEHPKILPTCLRLLAADTPVAAQAGPDLDKGWRGIHLQQRQGQGRSVGKRVRTEEKEFNDRGIGHRNKFLKRN